MKEAGPGETACHQMMLYLEDSSAFQQGSWSLQAPASGATCGRRDHRRKAFSRGMLRAQEENGHSNLGKRAIISTCYSGPRDRLGGAVAGHCGARETRPEQ